ncbi:glycoside hydrolase domain-containing protein [Streptomyces sp. 184]|uniref:glycoside hydrolase domain-containing protein n=1 Tax=Streptomyces sp. 184 TaxID=1827526 RepID=UPI003891AB96
MPPPETRPRRSRRSRRFRRFRLFLAPLVAVLAVFAGTLAGSPSAAGTAAPVSVPADLRDPRDLGAHVFRGRAFDTCHTPSRAAMSAWRASPYRAVGVYFAGRGRACPEQPHLTTSWLRGVHRMGWRVLPIYVGSQSPCVTADNKRHVRIDSARPRRQGRAEARDAVRSARALGMVKRSALYLDIEHFRGSAACKRTTLAYIRAWNREVRRHGWFPGLYSSANSGIRMIEKARRAGQDGMPSMIWVARWHTRPSLYGEPHVDPAAWRPHRRLHQYAGMVEERHGGKRILIDRNVVDAPVAIMGPRT